MLVAEDPVAGLDALLERHGIGRDEQLRFYNFGDDAAIVERICRHIRNGEKIATFGLPWLVEAGRVEAPQVGGLCVVTGADGRAAMLLRTTRIDRLAYGAIDASVSALDGPGIRDIEAWQAVHWPYFQTLAASVGRTATESMPVTVEHFEYIGD